MCDLEREIGRRLSGRILGVHPFATLIMALRLVRGKISRLPRAGLVSIEASWKMEARGLFRDGRWLGSEVNHSTEAALKAILATRRRTVDHRLGIRSQNPAADLY